MLSVNENEFQWEQKYRPKSISECILPEADKKIFAQIVKQGRIPSMILHSPSPAPELPFLESVELAVTQ